jgi:tungstate transport system substrate-binding protein
MLSRRGVLGLAAGAGALVGGAPLAATLLRSRAPEPHAPLPRAPSRVRVASVPTAVEGNVLPLLLDEFQAHYPFHVELTATEDVYVTARRGEVDLAVSPYGHHDAEAFVLDGWGEWPRTLFSDQMALLGPNKDPASVRGLEDAAEAFGLIAKTKSPFVVSDAEGARYLVEILWNAAGRPDRGSWFDDAARGKEAVRYASERGAYTFSGLTPYLRLASREPVQIEPLVLADPLLRRVLVSIIVRSDKVSGVNVEGARSLQSFLLEPSTQARIRDVRYPGTTHGCWVPGGGHNTATMLPKRGT